jgi:branched-chain amino acid transport system permease protein
MTVLVDALHIAFTYAVVALGYVLVFGVLRVVNLAYGQTLMLSTYAAVAGASSWGVLGGWIAAIFSAITVGLLIYALAIRPLGSVSNPNSARHLAVIVSTLGAGLAVQYTLIAFAGAHPVRFPQLLPSFGLGSTRFALATAAAAICAVAFIAIAVIMRGTFFGIRLRALASNRDLAIACGVRATGDEVKVVIISSVLAAVAGITIGTTATATSPFIGSTYGFKALLVIIAGGMNSVPGTLAAALLLGAAEGLSTSLLGSQYKDVMGFATLLIVVVIRLNILQRGTDEQ